jgi:putative nucleotidyltransferase with HDIG domain
MTQHKALSPVARVYVVTVVIAGTAILAHSARELYLDPINRQWIVLAALTLLTGSFTVKVPSTNASLSVSETFVFASVLLFGPAAGSITVLLECLIILFWMKPQGRSARRLLFNLAAPAIAIWTSGSIFFLVSGIEPYSKHTTPLASLFAPLLAFTLLYFLLNSWLVAIALSFETELPAVQIWWTNFTWLSVNYFSGASVAALIVTYKPEIDLSTLAIIIPLLVVSYLTFKTAMGRVEDSNRHLIELNRLYLSTIETLAMAIDAKDQITHGHIRRVQTYAVGLAKRVGVSDTKLIRAIEAAALLHDMGKLAVPEHILNKPGKLTAAEFEKMKLHASVGADILSAIEFPYPVVPIVRHHHENWDGTGYPAGLRGTDIPIGARILSVVDCFDALTSDRPYRPRLSDKEALAILEERRGQMYDPLVVDTFIRVHTELAPSVMPGPANKEALIEITNSAQRVGATPAPQGIRVGAAIPDASSFESMVSHLEGVVPFSSLVLFLYEISSDSIEARFVAGEHAEALNGVKIPRGQRLSGWVAANRQTILNSDPSLDIGEYAHSVEGHLRSCLSTPVVFGEQLVGVLTLYAASPDTYDESHRRTVEIVAKEAALAFLH